MSRSFEGIPKNERTLIVRPSARKSLVKGERFSRTTAEGPELPITCAVTPKSGPCTLPTTGQTIVCTERDTMLIVQFFTHTSIYTTEQATAVCAIPSACTLQAAYDDLQVPDDAPPHTHTHITSQVPLIFSLQIISPCGEGRSRR